MTDWNPLSPFTSSPWLGLTPEARARRKARLWASMGLEQREAKERATKAVTTARLRREVAQAKGAMA